MATTIPGPRLDKEAAAGVFGAIGLTNGVVVGYFGSRNRRVENGRSADVPGQDTGERLEGVHHSAVPEEGQDSK